MMYTCLGQAAQCPQSTVLPQSYLDGDDVAYLPGVAPSSAEQPSTNLFVPLAVAGTVIFLLWKFL